MQSRCDFINVNRTNKNVIAHHRQQTVGDKEHAGLLLGWQCQYRGDDRAEKVLLVDHRHDGKEHDQQRGERQGFLEGFADLVFINDAVERGNQDDHHQTDKADFSQVQCQANDQQHGSDGLNQQGGLLRRPALGLLGQEGACRVHKALARLPEAQRIVVVLKEFEDYTYQEIADTVGCKIGTVMSRLHLARQKLRTLLRKKFKIIRRRMD